MSLNFLSFTGETKNVYDILFLEFKSPFSNLVKEVADRIFMLNLSKTGRFMSLQNLLSFEAKNAHKYDFLPHVLLKQVT